MALFFAHQHTNKLAETLYLAPQRPTWNAAQKKGSLPAPPSSGNRFAALVPDDDGRRLSGADPASRDSSASRLPATAPAPDRQAALQAVKKLYQPSAEPPAPPQPVLFDAAQSSGGGSSREPSASRGQSSPVATAADEPPVSPCLPVRLPPPARTAPAQDLDELRTFAHTLVDEFVENDDYTEAAKLARERPRHATELAQLMLERVVEQRQRARDRLAHLLARFLRDQLLRPPQLAQA